MKFVSRVFVSIIFAVCLVIGSTSVGALAAAQTAEPPDTPGSFRILNRSGSTLRFMWDWVAGGVGAIHYELSYSGRTVVVNHYYPGHTQDIADLDLSSGHTYSFSLRAVDEVGNRSAVPAVLAFETTPPDRPSNLAQLTTRQGYPHLMSFSLSRDNAGSIRSYEAILNGKSLGTIPGIDNEFSLVDQIFVYACTNAPRGSAALQLRAYDSSFNASQLSEPLTVEFP